MPTEQKRYAVIVGVSDYETDEQIANLPCAKNDAIRVYEDLIKYGEFEADRSYLLVNDVDHDDVIGPSRGNVFQRMKYVCETASENDLIFFFFAGHGAEISRNPYLLTSDTMMDVLQQTAVKITDLNEMLEKSKARCIVRVFDSCRSPFAETRSIVGRMTKGLQDAMLKIGRGWASLSSCSSGEVAHESGELDHGVFTYYLCEGIEGKAANEKGEVTFERLVDYVKTSVGNWSDQQSQKQTPHMQSDLSGRLVLSSVSQHTEPVPVEVTNPLDVLRYGIEEHLATTAKDTRNLSVTTEEEMQRVSEITFRCLRNILQAFAHPALAIEIGEAMKLPAVRSNAIRVFNKDMIQRNLREEFKQHTSAVNISFSSSEVILPHTTLCVVVAQFSFFYWIWYRHHCRRQQLQGAFKPEPEVTKGLFTLKPKAALDGRKVENVIKELLKRSSEDILKWAEQLGGYVESRIEPLRKLGEIIE